MNHQPYQRTVDQAEKAVLFIHGILGTPDHFLPFLPLVPNGVSVYNLLLDGHGYSAKEFSSTSMKKWEAQIKEAVEELAETHDKIYIVAHSMGGLLAIEQAVQNQKIEKMFLLALPLKLSIKRKMFSNSAKVFFDKIAADDLVAIAAKECYGIRKDHNLFHYIGWPIRYLELFKKIRDTRQTVKQLSAQTAVYQSQMDEMVSSDAVKWICQNDCITVHSLSRSGHYYYEEADRALLLQTFQAFAAEHIRPDASC